ncbi:MAG: outer membrane lipoprotein-sorting protein [bacterium]|nr:outer membrane lipoprotein-sorting protein [bacterium]
MNHMNLNIKISKRFNPRKWQLFIVIIVMATFMVSASEKFDPKAAAILDGYIKATGGKAAYEKIRTRITKGTMEMSQAGIKMKMTLYQSLPNNSYTLMESDATGKMESGCNGDVVWGNSALQGPQLKEGDERAFELLTNRLDSEVNWREIYKKAEFSGEETVNGKPCNIVTLTTPEGQQMVAYYDKESKLVSRMKMEYKSSMGTMKIEINPTDYRKVDGILITHKMTMKYMQMELSMTMDSIQHNVEIPNNRFQLPKEIQALVDKEKNK